MGTAIMTVIAGVVLIAMVVYPLGSSPLFRYENPGKSMSWAIWKKEFGFMLLLISPHVIIREWRYGWTTFGEMVERMALTAGMLCAVVAGVWLISLGIRIWAQL